MSVTLSCLLPLCCSGLPDSMPTASSSVWLKHTAAWRGLLFERGPPWKVGPGMEQMDEEITGWPLLCTSLHQSVVCKWFHWSVFQHAPKPSARLISVWSSLIYSYHDAPPLLQFLQWLWKSGAAVRPSQLWLQSWFRPCVSGSGPAPTCGACGWVVPARTAPGEPGLSWPAYALTAQPSSTPHRFHSICCSCAACSGKVALQTAAPLHGLLLLPCRIPLFTSDVKTLIWYIKKKIIS